MKIAILGSTGFVGKVLIHKAVTAGYKVKTLARNPDKLEDISDKIEIIQGSVFDPSAVEATIEGTEAVLSTIDPPQRNPDNPELYEKALKNIVRIMNKQGIKRYIHIGGAAHQGGENEVWNFSRKFLRLFLTFFGKQILIAKHLEWGVLKASDLDRTLVRPPRIANKEATVNLSADEKNLKTLKVSVEDMTDFILQQISSKEWIRKAPLGSSGKR
jgi:nucleoside-diphosphate-sugar epimerase